MLNKQSFTPSLESGARWDKIKQGNKWKKMEETCKTDEGAVHLKNFKSVDEREKNLVKRLYNGEVCHSVKEYTKKELED